MSDLLTKMQELGANAEYKFGGLGEDNNGNSKPEYDCSGLITAAMKEIGYDITGRLSTSSEHDRVRS